VSYSGPQSPRILLVGEAWGADEEKARLPFVGVSGQELWRILGESFPDVRPDLHSDAAELCYPQWGLAWVPRRAAWLEAASIGMTNVLNMRPPNNKLEAICATKTEVGKDYPYTALVRGKYLRKEYLHHLDVLKDRISRTKPNLVVAMGNAACWGLLNTTGITAIRGTTVMSPLGVKVLPTFHPASLLYEGQWSNRPILIMDLMKAAREAEFPEIRRPHRAVKISPTLQEVRDWIEGVIANPPWRLAVDIETAGGIIDTIGFARSPSEAFVIPFGPHRFRRGQNYIVIKPRRDGQEVTSYWELEEEREVWGLVKKLLESGIPLVFQNGVYDLQYLLKMAIRPANCADDTMLAWHSLYPELRKSLGFIGSILTDESAWKELNRHRADTARREK
jgi:uracil-DNA glycosylase